MPGLLDADVAGVGEFDAGEIAGMRSAAWILLATVGINLLVWVVRRNGFPPVAILVDVFLGVQLLELKHNWRAWVLVRAGIGAAIGLLLIVGFWFSSTGPVVILMSGLSQLAYCGSLFLLLFGHPSLKRVRAGRLVFGLSVCLTVASFAFALTRLRA